MMCGGGHKDKQNALLCTYKRFAFLTIHISKEVRVTVKVSERVLRNRMLYFKKISQ